MPSPPRPRIFAAGNPLLDIIVHVSPDLLAEFALKPNDAILAGPAHANLYNVITALPDVKYVAGGAAQNTARCAQLMMSPDSTVYTGAVGRDAYADRLTAEAAADGVSTLYQRTAADAAQPTGTCAVLVSQAGAARSLVANLAAASCFSCDAFVASEAWAAAQASSLLYLTGYLLFSSTDAVRKLADLAWESDADCTRTLAFNIAANYICTRDGPPALVSALDHVLACADVIFCNDDEIRMLAAERPALFAVKATQPSVAELAATLAAAGRHFNNDSSHNGTKRTRMVVVTQGVGEVLVAVATRAATADRTTPPSIQSHAFAVPALAASDIVDTNGAGDAFAGGFLAHLAHAHALPLCVEAGIWLARAIIMQSGVVMPPRNSVPSHLTCKIE